MNAAGVITRHDAERVALIDGDLITTYGQLRHASALVARQLADSGVGTGDRVAMVAGTETGFAVGLYGIWSVGAVVVPVNPSSPASELRGQLDHVDVEVIVATDTTAELAAEVAGSERLLVIEAETAEPGDTADFSPVDVDAEHLACLMFTSGTSGTPRAAMLTHGNVLAAQHQIIDSAPDTVNADAVAYCVLPLFHIFGLNVALTTMLNAGAQVVLERNFDPVASVASIGRHSATVVAGVPPMWSAWAGVEGARDAFGNVISAVSGAAALPAHTRERAIAELGVDLVEGYGLTESSGVVTTTPRGEGRPGSVGVPLIGVEMRLVDETGADVPVGDDGEIWIRGENVIDGYWHDEEATAASIDADGWFHTGDIGVTDDAGHLRIVDRTKDMIIVSGFNVSPTEVEAVIAVHPGVEDSIVIGERDERSGERVVAFVVGDVDVDALGEHCLDHLARYKCPSRFELVDSVPVTPAGKRMRRSLARDAGS